MSNIRPSQVLAGPLWPISDLEGVNGDFFMLVGTNNTFIIFGPKANNTWVGVPQCTFENQLVPHITYLQYQGDLAGTGVVALPTNGTGINGQLCFLLDVNSNCIAVAANSNGIWSILFSGFNQPPTEILTSGGKPIFAAPTGNAFPSGSGPAGD